MKHSESVQATARRLRREGKRLMEIAAALDVPRSTVGEWVAEVETPLRACLLCGEPARSSRAHFCSRAHGKKYWAVFGAHANGPWTRTS